MASTYPLEVVQADRFAKENKKLKDEKLKEALDKQDWDASVKELVSTPTVLATMSDKLDWTQKLGDAVLAQQADVMDAIQRLRAKAQANGKLETTKQQTVTVKQEAAADQQELTSRSSRSSLRHPMSSTCPITIRPWFTASGLILTIRLITILRRRATSSAARLRPGSPGAQPTPSAVRSGTIILIGMAATSISTSIGISTSTATSTSIAIKKWQHDSHHRRGVKYNNDAVRNKFAKADARPTDRKLDYRGRSGEQVLKPGTGDRKPGGADRPGRRRRSSESRRQGTGTEAGCRSNSAGT